VKSILVGILAAASLAAAAALVLNKEFQRSAEEQFRTESVRL
jgi:hypothetical protein